MSNPATENLPSNLRELGLPDEIVNELEALQQDGGWTTTFGKADAGEPNVLVGQQAEPTVTELQPYNRRLKI